MTDERQDRQLRDIYSALNELLLQQQQLQQVAPAPARAPRGQKPVPSSRQGPKPRPSVRPPMKPPIRRRPQMVSVGVGEGPESVPVWEAAVEQAEAQTELRRIRNSGTMTCACAFFKATFSLL